MCHRQGTDMTPVRDTQTRTGMSLPLGQDPVLSAVLFPDVKPTGRTGKTARMVLRAARPVVSQRGRSFPAFPPLQTPRRLRGAEGRRLCQVPVPEGPRVAINKESSVVGPSRGCADELVFFLEER